MSVKSNFITYYFLFNIFRGRNICIWLTELFAFNENSFYKTLIATHFHRYIYTDRIEITSMDKACELCYVAKKYMLPVAVQRCTEFLWSDLNSKNVCRAFEFAKLFEEPDLAERCLQVN